MYEKFGDSRWAFSWLGQKVKDHPFSDYTSEQHGHCARSTTLMLCVTVLMSYMPAFKPHVGTMWGSDCVTVGVK